MELKDYQQQALDTLERYLAALSDARKKADELAAVNVEGLPDVLREAAATAAEQATDYPRIAWETLRGKGMLPGIADQVPEYIPRKTASSHHLSAL